MSILRIDQEWCNHLYGVAVHVQIIDTEAPGSVALSLKQFLACVRAHAKLYDTREQHLFDLALEFLLKGLGY